MTARRPLVLVDADDTLWENARYFTDVLDRWADWMSARGCARARAIDVLEACEERNIPRTGYGAGPFVASLLEAFEELLPGAPDSVQAEFRRLAADAEAAISGHPIRLLPGVEEALAAMAERADLVVFTKGQPAEQLAKLERSGVRRHFRDARVVPEKRPQAYSDECRRRGVAPGASWMVGNSARSDVNPARVAGLRTVHVPHPAPWHRDEEPFVAAGLPTRVARTFADVPHLVFG